MRCELCPNNREATHRTRRGLAVCTPCVRDIKRDTLHAPADFRPIERDPIRYVAGGIIRDGRYTPYK